MGFQITGDPAADKVLDDSAFALLVGMMLDQQYPMEHAFRGPAKVLDRFGTVEPDAIAAADPEEFAAMASTPPAIHRFPGSMAARLHELARIVEETYGGDASRLWTEIPRPLRCTSRAFRCRGSTPASSLARRTSSGDTVPVGTAPATRAAMEGCVSTSEGSNLRACEDTNTSRRATSGRGEAR